MSRFVILVLDGFGVGAMEDAAVYKAADAKANTCLHVLESNPELYLPNFEKLGLMNVLGKEMNHMGFSDSATYGKAKLKHYGADTFYGHQEIMGTDPIRTVLQSFASMFDKVAGALERAGYKVREYKLNNGAKVMGINDAVMVADNQGNEPGQVYNVIGLSDKLDFEEILKISRIIRAEVQVTRVIAHACEELTYEDLEESIVETWDGYAGLDILKYNIYDKNVQILHLGYGVDETVQAPYLLGQNGVPVTHLGKFADLVANSFGKSISCVNTEKLLAHLSDTLDSQKEGLIAANVQETDLSGHDENPKKYARILKLVDDALEGIIAKLDDGDIMIIMADHGNDPTSGSALHSREHVPLLIWGKEIYQGDIGIRETMSDVGATALAYFKENKKYSDTDLKHENTQNGTSFYEKLKNK